MQPIAILQITLVSCLVFVAPAAWADQPILFCNSASAVGAGKLVEVRRGGASDIFGKGVRSDIADSNPNNYVAPLFWQSPPAGNRLARRQTSAPAPRLAPELGSGRHAPCVGLPQGSPVTLKIRAWDAQFATFEISQAAQRGHGKSVPFVFRGKLSTRPPPTGHRHGQFRGVLDRRRPRADCPRARLCHLPLAAFPTSLPLPAKNIGPRH